MGNNKNVLLVVNPISGSGDKSDLIELVKKEVIKLGASLLIFHTTGNDDLFHLRENIKEVSPSRIIVAGGDGTIKIAAEALNGSKIPMGIIPAGSANGLAINLNLPQPVEEQIATAFGNSFLELDILMINGQYCLHMSDFGLNAELIENFEKSGIRGKFGYFLQTIPTLIQSEYPFQFQVETNGEILQRKGILLAVANARSYGTGATVNPKGKLDDGVFELLLFKEFDLMEILKTLRNEVEFNPEIVEIISTTKAKITCNTPVAFQIDGEYLGKQSCIEVDIIPKCIHIAIPRK